MDFDTQAGLIYSTLSDNEKPAITRTNLLELECDSDFALTTSLKKPMLQHLNNVRI